MPLGLKEWLQYVGARCAYALDLNAILSTHGIVFMASIYFIYATSFTLMYTLCSTVLRL